MLLGEVVFVVAFAVAFVGAFFVVVFEAFLAPLLSFDSFLEAPFPFFPFGESCFRSFSSEVGRLRRLGLPSSPFSKFSFLPPVFAAFLFLCQSSRSRCDSEGVVMGLWLSTTGMKAPMPRSVRIKLSRSLRQKSSGGMRNLLGRSSPYSGSTGVETRRGSFFRCAAFGVLYSFSALAVALRARPLGFEGRGESTSLASSSSSLSEFEGDNA